MKMIYATGGTDPIKNVPTPRDQRYKDTQRKADVNREKFCLSDLEILQLAKWAMIIEQHYTNKNKRDTPMDIEWACDGQSGIV